MCYYLNVGFRKFCVELHTYWPCHLQHPITLPFSTCQCWVQAKAVKESFVLHSLNKPIFPKPLEMPSLFMRKYSRFITTYFWPEFLVRCVPLNYHLSLYRNLVSQQNQIVKSVMTRDLLEDAAFPQRCGSFKPQKNLHHLKPIVNI